MVSLSFFSCSEHGQDGRAITQLRCGISVIAIRDGSMGFLFFLGFGEADAGFVGAFH
jgi:hypothetical protein